MRECRAGPFVLNPTERALRVFYSKAMAHGNQNWPEFSTHRDVVQGLSGDIQRGQTIVLQSVAQTFFKKTVLRRSPIVFQKSWTAQFPSGSIRRGSGEGLSPWPHAGVHQNRGCILRNEGAQQSRVEYRTSWNNKKKWNCVGVAGPEIDNLFQPHRSSWTSAKG